ncbi:MAG: metallophosphoesterase [Candidatus Helarchaeota archaeon]
MGKKILAKIFLFIIIYGAFMLVIFSGDFNFGVNNNYYEKAPYLSIVTGNASSAIGISFQTPKKCITTVFLGKNSSYLDLNISDPVAVRIHHFNITSLKPDTEYHYKINSSECNLYYMNKDYKFRTAPSSNKPVFSFNVVGDTRPDFFGYSAQRIIMKKMIETNPNFILNIGDIVLAPNREDHWQRFFDSIDINDYASTHPYMCSIGNHETIEYAPDYGHRFEYFMNYTHNDFYYAFNYSNTCFFALDINTETYINRNGISQAELDWLNETLFKANASKNINWIIGYWHYPAYASAGKYKVVQEIIPLLERYKVDVVFNGHIHYYERLNVNGTHYIITGGGGAELEAMAYNTHPNSAIIRSVYEFCHVEINNTRLTIHAIDQNGVIFDSLTLNQTNPWRL